MQDLTSQIEKVEYNNGLKKFLPLDAAKNIYDLPKMISEQKIRIYFKSGVTKEKIFLEITGQAVWHLIQNEEVLENINSYQPAQYSSE